MRFLLKIFDATQTILTSRFQVKLIPHGCNDKYINTNIALVSRNLFS